MAAGDGDGVIYVALHEHNEAVALRQDALPADPEDVLNLLSSEAAPLLCWFDTAKAYLSRAKAAAFLDIVKEANSDETLQGIRAYFNREPTFERVQLFCAMAAYYTEAARLERDGQNKAAMIAHAETCIKEAEALRSYEMLPSMARALLALARSDTTAAMMECRRAEKLLHNGRRNHAPLLVQAAIHYNSGSLAAAMNIYTTVLRQNPQCSPEVRLGIAACYYRAGKSEQAAAAYNRVLELDAQCADALLGLAVIKFGSRDAQEGLNAGLQLLQRAFEADPSHPGVLCALSHFCLLKGESDQALQLAQAALEASDTDRLRGVALSLLGRCHHAVGDLAAAQHHYAQAIRLDPKAPLPHLGTAQVYLATGGDPTNAVSELEEVLKALPGNSDALWLLGGLLPVLPDRVAKTLSRHREAAQRQVNDAGLQELLGELLAASEPADSLTAFQQALALHRKKQAAIAERNKARQQRRQKLMDAGDELSQELLAEVEEDEPLPGVPAKLLNNAAVLKYRSGQVAEALQLMSEATSVMMTDNSTSPMHKVSMGYNMARLQEATGDCKSASAGYQALLQQFPGYIDCYLRLAAMAKAAGDVEGARRWAASATEQAGGHVDSQAMLANLHLERGDLTAARTCVEAVKKAAGRDPYMLLTHANVVLAALPADRQTKTPASDKENHKQFILKALAMYREVLRQQPDNIYAVNGLGTCLAELGHLAAAKQAFDEVIRATSKTKGFVQMPECYVNLGNVWLARKQYNDAIRMYELASRLHQHKNPQILLYQARAQHDAGDHLAAKASLLRAIHLAPGSIKMRFDLAFVLQEWAVRVFKRKYPPGDTKKLSEYIQAEDALQQAERMFTTLAAMSKDVSRIEPRKLCMHRDFCTKQLPMAAALVKGATEEAHKAALQQKLRDAELAQAEAQRRHREVMSDAAKRAQEQKKKEEALKAREACDVRVAEMRARRALAPAEEDGGGGKGGGKKKRKKGAAGEALDDFYVDDTTPIERLPKKGEEAKKDKLKRAGLDSDDDDDAIDEENLFGSGGASDDEQQQQQQGSDGEAGQRQAGGAGRGRLKRRAADDDDAQQAAPADVAEDDDDDLFGDEGVEAAAGGGGGQGGGDGFVDSLFADEGEEDEGAGAAQPRKRQRQALASDGEDEEEGAAADGGGAAGNDAAAGDGDAGGAEDDVGMGLGDEVPVGLGNGDAGPAMGGEDDDMEDLFG